MLVLRQDDGQALSPPVEVAWRTPVDRIVLQEDDCAVVAGGFSRNRGYRAPKLVRFRKVQEQGNASCPTCEYQRQSSAMKNSQCAVLIVCFML